jgi:hypothetical protein
MGDQKAKDLPQAGANSKSGKGNGPLSHKPSDDARGSGLAARDADAGQNRTGRNTEGTGL